MTKSEILTGLNRPDDYILAIVEVDGDDGRPWYGHQPFGRAPDFGVTSVNYDPGELLARAEEPDAGRRTLRLTMAPGRRLGRGLPSRWTFG